MITTQQADELINRASRPGDGAIEDAEQRGTKVYYFFESGATGVVDLNSKLVNINRSGARDSVDPEMVELYGEDYAKLHSQWNTLMNQRTASKSSAERASLMTRISSLERTMSSHPRR